MATTVGELNAVLRLSKRDFDQGMGEAEGRFSRFGGTASRLAKGVAVGAAAAVAAVAVQGTKALVDFDTGIREVFTLLPGITDEARRGMEADVLAFAKSAGVIPGEVLPALYQAISAGVPEDNVFSFMETANKAAVGGITDLETAVDGITGVVNSYGIDVISAAEASDLMFTAVKAGKTDFGQLSSSLFQVLPTAAALGVGFGDVTAAMASMTKQNIPTRVATTQLRQLLVELSKDGGKASEAFKELSGQTFADFVAGGGDVADALEIMSESAADNEVALQDMFGSVEAGQAAIALAGPNMELFRANLGEMGESAGATDAAFEEMDEGLARTWEKIKVNAQVGILQAAQFIFDKLKELKAVWDENWDAIKATLDRVWAGIQLIPIVWLAMKVPDAIRKLRALWDENWDAIKATLDTVWGGIQKVLNSLIDQVKKIPDGVQVLRKKWDEHWDGIKATLDTVWAGIQEIFDSFIALVTVLRKKWDENWDAIKATLDTVWGGIKKVFSFLKDLIMGIPDAVSAMRQLWDEHWDAIKATLDELWAHIKPAVQSAMEFIKSVISLAMKIIKIAVLAVAAVIWVAVQTAIKFWQIFGDTIMTLVGAVWDFVVRIIGTAFDLIKGLFDFFAAVFTGKWGAAWDAIKDIASAVWDAILTVFQLAWDAIIFAFNFAIDFLGALWDLFWTGLKAAATAGWNLFTGWLSGVWDTFTGLWSTSWEAITGKVQEVWDGITGVATKGWETFTGWFSGIWETFKTLWSAGWTAISDAVSGAFSGAVGAVQGVINGILSAVETGINWAIRQINKVIGAYNKIPGVPDRTMISTISLPRLSTRTIGSLPRLHTGGRVPGPPGTDQMAMLRAGETVGRSGLGDAGQQWPRELRLVLGDDQGDDLAEFMMDRGVHLLRSSQGMHT